MGFRKGTHHPAPHSDNLVFQRSATALSVYHGQAPHSHAGVSCQPKDAGNTKGETVQESEGTWAAYPTVWGCLTTPQL